MIRQQPVPANRPRPVPAAMATSPGSPNGNPLPPARSQERPAAGRGKSNVKSNQPSQPFEGLYANSRMLHYVTAAVGTTCDVKVKNGNTFQGVFRAVSSKFEMAVDAVHKASDQAAGPKREEIVDTMVFKNTDVICVKFQNVDFSYATKDKFTDSAIAMNSKVNGEHKDKVLLRWEGGVGGADSNGEDFELDSDMSNGWDPNEMFKFNEDNYGVKTTYDSSLSSYTVPLEKDNTDEYRQREARAAQLAREIESSPQYRARIAVENDDGRSEEEKHSSVQRPSSDRDSPSFSPRDGKYVPLAQRTRDGSRGGLRTNSSRGGRPGMGSLSSRSAPQHYPDAGSSPVSEQRVINGGLSRMSPKSQRPMRGSKTMTSPSNRSQDLSTSPSAPSRVYIPLSPKSGSSVSSIDNSQASTPDSRPTTETNLATKPTSPKAATPTMAVEGKDVQVVVVKEQSRTLEQNAPCDTVKPPCKVLQTDQKRTQLDELRKFGAEFRLQPTSAGPESALEAFPPRQKETLEAKMPPQEAAPVDASEPHPVILKAAEAIEEPKEERVSEIIERQEEAASPACKPDVEEKEEAVVCEQVKKSTLNPNAKEFNPKALLSVNKATSTPTSPGPRNPSTTTLPIVNPGQYSSYMYIPQIHMSPAVQSQIYPYAVSNSVPGQQGKYRPKGPTPRSDQPSGAPPIMQAAAAAGPPLVAATPYSPYISYSPQQFPGQAAMMQPMAHYPSQPVFAQMLQSNQRMLTSGNHPQALVSSSNHQYQTAEQPTPQQIYATVQSYSHHAAQLHPQPASTPTQSQQQTPHANPSPVQHQGGQPPHLGSGQPQQNIYHTAALTATPPSMTPGPTAQSPQSNYPQQAVYAIHAHQQLQHGYTNMSHVAQAHVQTGMTGAPPPHPGAPHPQHPGAPHPTQVMLLHPAQTHGGPPQGGVPQTGVSTPSPFSYMPHPQVQSHPSQQLPFHPPGN